LRKQNLCVIVRKCAVGKAALPPSSVTARFTVSSVSAKGTPRHLPHSYAVGKALALSRIGGFISGRYRKTKTFNKARRAKPT